MSTTETTTVVAGSEAAPAGLLDDGRWRGRIFSGGWLDAPDELESYEPATGELLATVGAADRDAVARACAAAAAAQAEWAATAMTDRIAIVRRAGELFEAHR